MPKYAGRDLILIGSVMLVATYSPDKAFGYSIGIGLILLGLCVITSRSEEPHG